MSEWYPSHRRIRAAWRALRPTYAQNISIVEEHGQPWILHEDSDDVTHTISVVECGDGPGAHDGIGFEDCD